MKKWVFLAGLVCAWCLGIAQDRAEYIDHYKDIAVTEMMRTGIPASIKLAQAMLESDCGRSELAQKANNHFGIKCGNDWKGKSFKKEDDDYEDGRLVKSCFREFRNAYDSYVAHSEFLMDPAKSKRYGSLFSLDPYDYKGWAKGLSKAGYATDPNYSKRLIDLIEKYDLHKYDQEDTQEIVSAKKPKPGAALSLIQYNNDVKYVVASAGATPSSIAEQFDVTVRQVVRYNDDIENEDQLLVVGSKVYLQPKRSQTHGRQKTHLLKEGESLVEISQQYGIKIESLMKRNGLMEGEIPAANQKLVLKGKSKKKLRTRSPFEIPEVQPVIDGPEPMHEETSVTPSVSSDREEQIDPPVVIAEQSQMVASSKKEHVVAKGETLYSISRQYGLSHDELKKINNLSADTIFIGQKLALQ